jgi:putative membrane protein
VVEEELPVLVIRDATAVPGGGPPSSGWAAVPVAVASALALATVMLLPPTTTGSALALVPPDGPPNSVMLASGAAAFGPNAAAGPSTAVAAAAAEAAARTTNLVIGSSVPSVVDASLTAYGHYLSMFVIVGAILTERATVKPDMTTQEEWRMGWADIALGVSALGVLLTGYRRLSIERGVTFYIHQPFFWVKMAIVGYDLGLSLFVTVIVVQRTVQMRLHNGTVPTGPMSDRMAGRIREVTGQHLAALAVMPLAAALMARGVGSNLVDSSSSGMAVPTAGAVFVCLTTLSACVKYSAEAVNWDYGDTEASDAKGE